MESVSGKGKLLEERIAAFLTGNGYSTKQNVYLEGRSGGRHEIDVLAEKDDGITTFRVAVECKAWNTPIEKDVVSKLAYVMSDLGLNKGIVVSLKGSRIGAVNAASQLGIEIWGPEELDKRLGQAAVAALNLQPSARSAMGFLPVLSDEQAGLMLDRQGRGIFGIGKEQSAWEARIWLPFHVFQIGLSTATPGGLLRRATMRTQTVWNIYDGLVGHFYARYDSPPTLREVALSPPAIPPAVRDQAILAEMRKAFKKWDEVVTASAKQRHANRLLALGVPVPIAGLTVSSSETIFIPFRVRLLVRGVEERVVAANLSTGVLDDGIGRLLTANLAYVRSAFVD
jgi:hypothetical protein